MGATLLCVHGLPLFVGEIQGIFHYQHEDGSSCTVYNSFAVTCEEICVLLSKDVDASTPLARATFLASLPVRLEVYKYLSTLRDREEVKTILGKVGDYILRSTVEGVICGELEWCFGPVIWESMGVLFVEPFKSKVQVPNDVKRLPEQESLTLVNLSRKSRGRAWLVFEDDSEVLH